MQQCKIGVVLSGKDHQTLTWCLHEPMLHKCAMQAANLTQVVCHYAEHYFGSPIQHSYLHPELFLLCIMLKTTSR